MLLLLRKKGIIIINLDNITVIILCFSLYTQRHGFNQQRQRDLTETSCVSSAAPAFSSGFPKSMTSVGNQPSEKFSTDTPMMLVMVFRVILSKRSSGLSSHSGISMLKKLNR
ncbi:hypothetical protein L2E82_31096 [Cichorium intybus]|uniref:Uncharacterized protein n=1 Tax=Cichorium intybus TaxID=13427 RepID=A0ACB9D285_CICIN|nr:hypothetical protein L2E82_31096 [Cichorium intybus]